MNPKTIMLVDDDESTALLFTASLGNAGFTVKCFARADEAWKHLRTNPYPDLILLDLLLPGELDGMSLLEVMKKEPGIKDIPVIIISNTVMADSAKRAHELGTVDVLIKAETGLKQMVDHVVKYFDSKGSNVPAPQV